MAAADLGTAEWERSKITNQDLNLLKKLGISKKPKAVCFPSEESYPTPPMGYRNTRGKELSGIQITAYFLRTRVQPLQARKNPFWNYAGDEDTDRLSTNLEVKDLDRLIRKISSLKKKDPIPSTYRVKPYSATNALPKEDASEATASAQSPPPAVSPKNKRKRNDAEDSGTSKPEEAVPSCQKGAYDPYLEALISSDDEEEVPTADVAARTKKLAEVNERANTLAQKLEQSEEARKKAESDAVEARQEADKAKADAAGVEDLRKRLHDAETSLSDHIAAQIAREEAITKRIRTQNRRFVNKTSQEFELEDPDNDPLLDAVSFLEFHGTEAREGIDEARAGLSRLFPYFFPKKEEPATFLTLAKCFNPPEDLGLKMRHENMKVAVESTVALVADSQQTIDWSKVGNTEQIEQTKWRSLIKAAKLNTKKILAYLGIKPSSTPSSSRPEV
ncbi:hypothetical protein QYE76_044488 [Lolium multiflorum]|uniref:Uncharacterized protein n=1 Tax=Lolium multiflorum TaxID=4521 RepID=A0AAD8WWT7_LOLMU|nr:hypothetical protein QYE76_044488 [Lolium multiflorum]